jgi:hypothetical protein
VREKKKKKKRHIVYRSIDRMKAATATAVAPTPAVEQHSIYVFPPPLLVHLRPIISDIPSLALTSAVAAVAALPLTSTTTSLLLFCYIHLINTRSDWHMKNKKERERKR